jgi:hypothetical protein
MYLPLHQQCWGPGQLSNICHFVVAPYEIVHIQQCQDSLGAYNSLCEYLLVLKV